MIKTILQLIIFTICFNQSFASTIPLVYATTVKNIGRVIKLSDGTFATIKLSRQATETLIATLKNSNLSENSLKLLFKDLENTNFAKALAENPKLVNAWKKLDDLGETTLKTDVDWLKRVDDWDGAGVQLSKNGDNLKLADGSGNALGEFKNGDLLPEKYDFPVNASSTPVGDVNNGYQVFKDGSGNLSVRRVPDKSPYNASELTELTQHPNAHVLERHGHDVTDDALIKRAQTPSVAPDGKVANNPPPHSSKFNSADDLKEGLNNTRPGTTAFNNGVQQGNTRIVTYTSTKVLGKGVPRNGNSFVNMQKVKAIYRDVGGGNYQLITMYPEL